MDLTLVIV